MNTADLLATIAPHAEMLKGLGWEVTGGNPVAKNVTEVRSPEDWDVMSASNAALILEAVVMRELEKWARESCENIAASRHVTCSPSKSGLSHAASIRGTDCELLRTLVGTTRLAALLALLAWTREESKA